MEIIVKQTREVGTSAGVLLPRSWLNKQVVVTILEPSMEEIARGVFDILIKEKLNFEVKGLYLYGSYARGDNDERSDIDILVITGEKNRLINSGNYEILLVSEENFSSGLVENLNYVSALKEAKTILNKGLIEKYKARNVKFNNKKYLSEIGRVIKINKDTIETCENKVINVPDGIIYSVILRARELYIIKGIFSNKFYSKWEFIRLVGEKAYSAYLRVKRNEREINNLTAGEMMPILKLSEKWLRELRE